MKPLSAYKKQKVVKQDCIQTSVSIRRDQKLFVDNNSLNLSEVTRDALDVLIQSTKNPQAKGKIK